MSSLWQNIKSAVGLGSGGEDVKAAVSELIAVAEPKLELLSGARHALAEGARRSLAYADMLASRLPVPLDLSPQGYNADPRVGLLFANAEALYQMLRGSDALRDFFLRASNGDEAFALLVMQCQQKRHFGSALRGGQLLDDVAQTVVSFGAHRLLALSPDQAALQAEVKRRAFHSIAAVASRRIALQNGQLQSLSTEKMQVELKLATLSGSAIVVDALPGSDALPASRTALNARLAEINQQLEALAPAATLEGKLGIVRRVSGAPEEFLSLNTQSLFLDRMGVLRSPEQGEEGVALDVESITFGKIEPIERVVMPVRVSRQALDAWQTRLG